MSSVDSHKKGEIIQLGRQFFFSSGHEATKLFAVKDHHIIFISFMYISSSDIS